MSTDPDFNARTNGAQGRKPRAAPEPVARSTRSFRSWAPWKRAVLLAYLVLLVASHAYTFFSGGVLRKVQGPAHQLATLPVYTHAGEPTARTWNLAFRRFPDDDAAWRDDSKPAVLLLHGSPGTAIDFDKVIPTLTNAGYRVLVPDLLGMWWPFPEVIDHPPESRSIAAYARALIDLADQLHIRRIHVVGWSNGGGIAQHMGDLAPERVASLSLVASIGLQEHEWSGSYAFEHGKYKMGKAIVGGVPVLLPHFGALGTYATRTAWLDYFDDTDQRPLRDVMRRLGERGTPTLILHGRHDVLVPWRAAVEHHELIRGSRLVMLDANHFLPFLQPEETSRALLAHFARHDAPGAEPLGGVDDRAPISPPVGVLDRLIEASRDEVHAAPWWAEALAIALMALISPAWTVVFAGLFVVGVDLDPAVALVGLVAGFMVQTLAMLAIGRRGLPKGGVRFAPAFLRLPRVSPMDWRRRMSLGFWGAFKEGYRGQFFKDARVHSALGAGLASTGSLSAFVFGRFLASIVWSLVALLVVVLAEALLVGAIREKLGLLGVAYTLIKLYILANLAPMLLTRGGRQHLHALVGRLVHHEYWPTWVFYIPLQPYVWYLALKHKGFHLPTCCNPDIQPAGGWAGESKFDIMSKLRGPGVLATAIIRAGPIEQRLAALAGARSAHGELAAYPVVLKPDQGQRGHAFKVCRSDADARAYLSAMTGDAVVQPFHPGPEECGILWVRTPGSPRGSIYAITRKRFPFVEGDGVRTLEELIRDHPRFRKQAAVFLDRFLDEASRVPGPGERVRLAHSGNHCQGTLFEDGADLQTPELERTIDAIASSFPRLDVGRFDVRYESDELLREGRGFGIVELNGITSEPTNMYDPHKSALFAYRVLFGLWKRIYELGRERRDQGVRPVSVLEVIRLARRQSKEATGSAVAD